jgi:hypothetical protein
LKRIAAPCRWNPILLPIAFDVSVGFNKACVRSSDGVDTIKRVNRLLSYRSMQHRERYGEHAKQHLEVLDLIERDRNEEASEAMRQHLLHTLDALSRISQILEP